MTKRKKNSIKLWLVVAVSVVFWTVGTGFNQQLSADSDETYKGLKLFSEVIELVQKNYVDEVESTQLIEKAIQNRDWSVLGQGRPEPGRQQLQQTLRGLVAALLKDCYHDSERGEDVSGIS